MMRRLPRPFAFLVAALMVASGLVLPLLHAASHVSEHALSGHAEEVSSGASHAHGGTAEAPVPEGPSVEAPDCPVCHAVASRAWAAPPPGQRLAPVQLRPTAVAPAEASALPRPALLAARGRAPPVQA